METRQVLLICIQPLLSEGLQRIFQAMEGVEVVQPAGSDQESLEQLLDLGQPDVIVIAGEQDKKETEHLISMLLNHCAEVPVIWVGLEDSQVHVYSSRILPANSAGLADLMNHLGPVQTNRKKIPSRLTGGDTYAI